MTATLPVFYTDRMVADSGGYSPSAAKPAQLVAHLLERGMPIEIREPAPATIHDIALAHSFPFVRAVLACERPNGFGNTSPAVARSLPYTTGAMLSAARHVLAHGGIACAPCSGFHHAGYAHAGGYCTFNGLMVTACVLRSEHRNIRVGILDLDMHYGDGTDDIIETLDASGWVEHFTGGEHYTHERQVDAFFAELPSVLLRMAECDVVLFQAGADPHIDDPLGGWLTTQQLAERDQIVLSTLHKAGVPVAWNLAGGYQRDANGGISKVLEIHENTVLASLQALELT